MAHIAETGSRELTDKTRVVRDCCNTYTGGETYVFLRNTDIGEEHELSDTDLLIHIHPFIK